jgi:hypothetical protein
LAANDHKTVKIYGPQAKYLTAALKKLLILLAHFKRAGSGEFLERAGWKPDGPANQKVYCTRLLDESCEIYIPALKGIITCTIIRKLQTAMTTDVDKVMEAELKGLCQIDGHTVAVTNSHYLALTLKQMATNSKHAFARLFGETVKFPSVQECEAEVDESHRRYREHFINFKSFRKRSGTGNIVPATEEKENAGELVGDEDDGSHISSDSEDDISDRELEYLEQHDGDIFGKQLHPPMWKPIASSWSCTTSRGSRRFHATG